MSALNLTYPTNVLPPPAQGSRVRGFRRLTHKQLIAFRMHVVHPVRVCYPTGEWPAVLRQSAVILLDCRPVIDEGICAHILDLIRQNAEAKK